jgi:hypothetical protein
MVVAAFRALVTSTDPTSYKPPTAPISIVFVKANAGALPICALSVAPGTWFGFQFVVANQFVAVTTVFVQSTFAENAVPCIKQ